MPQTLADFPVDEITLNNILHSLNGCYEVDESGTRTLVGADFTLTSLLDFMSGADPDNSYLDGYTPDGTPIYVSTEVHYSMHDVIRALANEIVRLRTA